ncbi:MAG TPA: threonine--tRNA ligase [Verrucomicrobiae bacterium]|nr:threonine--tRNA ligase [Verrucomicrobiae bacterium]
MAMTPLEELRHSTAHVLATAVVRLFPEAKLDIGPPTDTGFYYDFDIGHRFTPEDLGRIEAEMAKVVAEDQPFERREVTRDEARAFFEGRGQPYKISRLGDIPEGEPITFYRNGEFVDLCAGTHVPSTGKIKAFKLLSIAGAYHRGDERNKQLQRLYGTAFPTREELETHLHQLEEAKKRDHRKIGREMQLFAFDEDVGPGLPLWLPKGTVIVEELERLAKETEFAAGYERVRTPHLARESMYLTSGHLPYYAESMFPPMTLAAEGVPDEQRPRYREEFQKELHGGELTPERIDRLIAIARDLVKDLPVERYYIKAMNCPHHHKIYKAVPRSYRDLPLRLAEYGACYRYEQSGELFGLMRVRSMQMNDAHIYCTPEQFEAEFNAVNEMYLRYFKLFGIGKYRMRFSTHDPSRLGEKFVGEPGLWLQTEEMVRRVLVNSGIDFVEVPNEAAFYGPKIDVQVWSAIGREFTIATNQVDFAVPKRFGLEYVTAENTKATPLCIHRAPLGTHERFIGFLIEHFAGDFPLWLAPEQVRLLPITDAQMEFARGVERRCRELSLRATVDASSDKLGAKVRRWQLDKVPYGLVIGKQEAAAGTVSVRSRPKGDEGGMALDAFLDRVAREYRERTLTVAV